MRTIPEQLSDLQMRLMQPDEVQRNVYAITRTCRLCGARSVVLRTVEDTAAEIAKTPHDPACLLGMLYKATLWVAGSYDWGHPQGGPSGFRFSPTKTIEDAAKVMAREFSSHESWVDDDGTVIPDGRRLFMVLDLPMPAEFVAAYEAEKLAGLRRVAQVEWEREVREVDRLRERAVNMFKELYLDADPDLNARMHARVGLSYPYPPKPDMVDE